MRDIFQEAFLGVWRGELEDDGLNGLVLAAGLTGREIMVIRAIGKYLRQARIPFSDAYMVRTLLAHPDIAAMLLRLFVTRFDPERRDKLTADPIDEEIERTIDAVESLDEDRILRSFLSVVGAILRTKFFRVDNNGHPAPYLSFKLDPARVPLLPLPRPRFEIFVYSPRVEGIHLRGGKVARGGLRWSDRPEDFRTEVHGLMEAQMVKNALIVPVGAKGGFVVKRPPSAGGKEALLEEAIACYEAFLSGLLDVTDNIAAGEIVTPDRVVSYDEADPYLQRGAGPAIPVALLAAIPAEQSGIASGIANALRNVAATLGVAIFGALLAGSGGFSSGVQRVFLVSAGTLALAVCLTLAWIRPRARHRIPIPVARPSPTGKP